MRIILLIINDRYEAFTSLKPFFEKYPQYEQYKYNIETYLSRKNKPYKNKDFTLIRLEVEKSVS